MRLSIPKFVLGSILSCAWACACFAQPKKVVKNESELPRFTYKVTGNVADLLKPDSAAFKDLSVQVKADLDSILQNYQVEDKSTERELLGARLSFEEMAGQNDQALRTIDTIRGLEEKPDAKLTADLIDRAIVEARIDAKATSGAAYDSAFTRRLSEAVNQLPWNVVQGRVKELKGADEMTTPSFLAGKIASNVQPMVEKSGAVDNQTAWQIVALRFAALYKAPVKGRAAEVLQSYITKNSVEKPDIWAARDVTLSPSDKLTPVLIGIWDSGVDVSNFPQQLYSDPAPDWHDAHGLAFDDQGGHSKSLLLPIPEDARKDYAAFLPTLKGVEDQDTGVDTPEASAFRQKVASMQPEQSRALVDRLKIYDPYIHGTHVAGIAVHGNPAARLVVFRFNDQLADLTFAPTAAWAKRLADDFREIGEYCRTHHVRVVNMSWGDQPSEFERMLSKTGQGQDAAARKKQAMELFEIWKAGIADAIQSSPGTLFICAAGNSDSNPGFDEDVPPSLHLPNLIAVGAVNQAGDETSFTSYGDTVIVDADGYNVESYVPGGARMKLSGTSMASPGVTNLAAKLFAVDPSLTPAQAIALIKDGATASDNGRLHLIDEKRSIALLKERARH
jgi:subtilisin family serine protease